MVKPKVVGVGFTVTVIVNGAPVHVLEVGVTTYSKVAGAVVVLIKVWLIVSVSVVCATPPVIAAAGVLTGVVQV